jgi:hypothetical protein
MRSRQFRAKNEQEFIARLSYLGSTTFPVLKARSNGNDDPFGALPNAEPIVFLENIIKVTAATRFLVDGWPHLVGAELTYENVYKFFHDLQTLGRKYNTIFIVTGCGDGFSTPAGIPVVDVDGPIARLLAA